MQPMTDYPPVASADFAFTEDLFAGYRDVRNARQMRFYGWCLLVVGVPLAVLCAWALTLSGPSPEGLGLLALSCALVGLGAYVVATGRLGLRASASVYRDFFGRRGADVGSRRPWSFRERVVVDEGGITVCYGPVGASDDELRVVRKGWGEWRSVHVTPEAVIVLCDAKTGPAARWLLGFDFALYDEKRNTFEDAVLPTGSIVGMTPAELEAFLRARVRER